MPDSFARILKASTPTREKRINSSDDALPIDLIREKIEVIWKMSSVPRPMAATVSWIVLKIGTILAAATPKPSNCWPASMNTCRGKGDSRANTVSSLTRAFAFSADPSRVVKPALVRCISVLYDRPTAPRLAAAPAPMRVMPAAA